MVRSPGFPNSQHAYAESLLDDLRGRRRWLDLGCGHRFLPPWLDGTTPGELARAVQAVTVVGIDLDRRALGAHAGIRWRVVANIEAIPLADAAFDVVTANMVVEHVEDPVRLFREVRRLLAPGGVFLVHTPNAAGYTTRLARCVPSALRPRVAKLLQGRDERDVYRTYYRANTTGALRRLAAESGLAVADLRTVTSSPQFFRVPLLRWCEERFLARLADERRAAWRPCIIGRFGRPGA